MPAAGEWDPDSPAVWRERAPGEDRAITLRHPTYPFEADWTTDDPAELLAIAARYLLKVREAFGLPDDLVEGGPPPQFKPPLAWLPIHSGEEPAEPGRSFWVRRYDGDAEHQTLVDRTVVCLAVKSAVMNEPATAIGSRLGLRVVAQVAARGPAPWKVRITSAACSTGLASALGPHPGAVSSFFEAFFSSPVAKQKLRLDVTRVAGLSDEVSLWIDGFQIRGTAEGRAFLEMYANVSRPVDEVRALAYALTAQLSVDPSGVPQVEAVTKWPLTAPAAPVTARLFPQDPASEAGGGGLVDARPNRSPRRRLQRFRQTLTLPGLTLGPGGSAQLLDDLGQVKVAQSKLVHAKADETQPEVVKPGGLTHARMNPFAALSGYQHARELFDTMRGYGLSPIQHFKFAGWPLVVRYRAPIRPGPGKDGKTVNAQVNYDPADCDLIATPWDPTTLKPLQVRFALADLKRSTSRREPLGLAAGRRWSWHEYGHVLLAASTGALEFLFCHSAGDALAAVACDPRSELATHPRLRGATFPWVYIHRRHDRSVYYGWSWSGKFHRPARFPPGGDNCRRKGYQSEQILSTSLFRLYRALGGDTVRSNGKPDRTARAAAADYTLYLIIRAIGSLPPAYLMQTETPDQLVTALMDADAATTPVAQGPLAGRVGGWAHKVARWAFEAQGLYATTNPLDVVDAPGKPPPIDVFIDTRRPDANGARPRGGYMPVSLDWHTPPHLSPWHASDSAIQVPAVPGDEVSVAVRNRGALDATSVTVRVWWADAQPTLPKWNEPGRWTALGAIGPQTVPAWPAPAVPFGPFANLPTQPSGRRLVILAAATCPGDHANIDPATSLPCSTEMTPIVDLVAGDNNLGLRWHVVP